MDRRDFIKLSFGAAGMAASPGIAAAAPLRMGVTGLLPVGGMLSIGSAPKRGKSLLAMDLALLLAGAKGKLLERFPVLDHGPVAYFGSGMTMGAAVDRLTPISTSRGIAELKELSHPIIWSFGYRVNLASGLWIEDGMKDLIGPQIRKYGVKYLVIDPIEDFGGVEALEAIDKHIGEFNLSGVIFTYTSTKAAANLHALGSPILGGWGNTHILMNRKRDEHGFSDGAIRFQFETRDIPDPKPMTARIDYETLRFLPA